MIQPSIECQMLKKSSGRWAWEFPHEVPLTLPSSKKHEKRAERGHYIKVFEINSIIRAIVVKVRGVW